MNLRPPSPTIKDRRPSPAGELLISVLAGLRREGVPFVVMGNPAGLPATVASDVDLIVPRAEWDRFPSTLARLAGELGTRMVQVIRHERDASVFTLAAPSLNGAPGYLALDVAWGYSRSARRFLEPELLLDGRREHVGDGGTFPVPQPAAAFAYYLLKSILKGDLDTRKGMYLSAKWDEDPQGARALIARWFDASMMQQIESAAVNFEWEALAGELPRFTKAIHQHQRLTPTMVAGEAARLLHRSAYPAGLTIAVMGPDGSGKSLLLEGLRERVGPLFRRSHSQHFRPGLEQRGAAGAPVTEPHAQPARGPLLSVAKLGFYVCDTLLGYAAVNRPRLVRAALVLYDRTLADIVVDPRRYRYGAPLTLARLASRAVPSPDLTLVLDAPADVIRSRTAEVALEEVERQLGAYRELARSMPTAHVIDASRSAKDVLRYATDVVLDFMAHRTATRLGL